MNKRDANKQFNRNAILDAARKVFAQAGFANANITQIIEISGFSTGTFYNYFQTKDQLMDELSLNILHLLQKALFLPEKKLNTSDDIDHYIDGIIISIHHALIENNIDDIRLVIKNQAYFRDLLLNHPKWEKLVENVTKFIQTLVTPEQDAALISQITFGAFVVLFAYQHNHPETDPATVTHFMKKYLKSAFKGFE